jgi:hypothetical protein
MIIASSVIDNARSGQPDSAWSEAAIEPGSHSDFDRERLNNPWLLPGGPKRNSYRAIAFPLMLDYQVVPVWQNPGCG